MNTWLPYMYNKVNIKDYSDEELEASDNPFAWVMLIAKQAFLRGRNRQMRLLEKKWVIFKKLHEHGLFEDHKLQAIAVFMEHYLPFDDPEIGRIFRERVDSLTDKTNTMDIFEQVKQIRYEEGRREGRQEGEKNARETIVCNLLANTEFSDKKIASVAGVPVALVARIRKKQLPPRARRSASVRH
jgi:hypothetical protein